MVHKVNAIIQQFQSAVNGSSNLGIYSAARSIFEFAVHSHRVNFECSKIHSMKYNEIETDCNRLIKIYTRGLYGTRDPNRENEYSKLGIPLSYLKVFNITDSIEIFNNKYGNEMTQLYSKYCDYVHHNGPSNFGAANEISDEVKIKNGIAYEMIFGKDKEGTAEYARLRVESDLWKFVNLAIREIITSKYQPIDFSIIVNESPGEHPMFSLKDWRVQCPCGSGTGKYECCDSPFNEIYKYKMFID